MGVADAVFQHDDGVNDGGGVCERCCSLFKSPAELAFGTGDHATTSTCLRLLVDISREHAKGGQEWSMLDLGSGTGLLAIAAHKLGADPVEGFDFDATAVEVSLRNLERNSASGVWLHQGDVFEWQPEWEKWDVIAANLFADILSPNLDKIAHGLKQGGHWILSGILREHEEGVLEAAAAANLPEPRAIRRGKWVTLYGTR